MGTKIPNEQEMQALVRDLGVEPDGNFLLAQHHNSAGKSIATELLGGTYLNARSEQPFAVVFAPDAIITQRLKDDQVHRYPRAEVEHFTVRDGAEESVVFDFDWQGEHLSFYANKDASMRLRYVADNLRQLLANDFGHYAQDMSHVGVKGLAAYKYPVLESILPLGLLVMMVVTKDAHIGRGLLLAGALLAFIWVPKLPRPTRR
ncbi:hypothetical protein [Lacticaseibacillus absianus]|uniref:hypothetical protein n=1 Tax=Lacticaseibacillus absianus TaxID=2729623 RepID=UPI0015C6B46B|nr:hypothetical protein [Lacticaseibacillus absianus]